MIHGIQWKGRLRQESAIPFAIPRHGTGFGSSHGLNTWKGGHGYAFCAYYEMGGEQDSRGCEALW